MSVTARGFIEALYPKSRDWWCVAKIHFYGNVPVYSVLAHPWEKWSPEEGNPAPVVPPKGFPEDASLIATHEAAYYVEDEPEDGLTITPQQAEEWKCRPYKPGYVLKPDIRCTTWLTLAEVEKAVALYVEDRRAAKAKNLRSEELDGIAAMMRAIEQSGPVLDGVSTVSRLVMVFD